MDAVRKFFPASTISESVIRKVFKTCADFKREGYETGGWWVLRGDFRLPLEEELRSLITPEQMCSYYSMLVAEARLNEAGYRGRTLFVVEEEEEESSAKIDDEVCILILQTQSILFSTELLLMHVIMYTSTVSLFVEGCSQTFDIEN